MPRVLYRYYSWHDEHGNAKTVLSNNKLYLSNPLDLNDPFDSKIPVDIAKREDLKTRSATFLRNLKNSPTEVKLNATVERLMKTVPKTREEFVEYWGNVSNNTKEEKLLMLFKRYIDDLPETADEDTVAGYHLSCEHDSAINSYGVYCLSEKRDITLMWSHYADSHKGVCFGFNTRLAFEENFAFMLGNGTTALGIKYQAVPELDYSSEGFHEKVLFTKSCDWKYEREWRVIERIKGQQRLFNIPPEALSEVILGCEMPGQDRNKVIGLVKGRETKPKVYRAKKSGTKSALEFEEISLD